MIVAYAVKMTSFVVLALALVLNPAFLVQCFKTSNSEEFTDDGHFRLLLLHNNDLHSHFMETDVYSASCSKEDVKVNKCYGGFARMKQAVNDAIAEAKTNNISTIFLNAGDSFQGTPFYTLYKRKIVAPMMESLGLDVMSLGNHEFDDGIEHLVQYLMDVKIPVVACNLNLTSEPSLKTVRNLTASKIINVENRKIGIIGYLTPNTTWLSKTRNLQIFDEIPYIREEAIRLKQQGVKIIIALGHSGIESDIIIAKQVPQLSLIVGGHSHTLLYTPPDKPPSVEPVFGSYPYIVTHESGKIIPIVQAYAFSKYLGKLWVTFNENGDVISAKGNPQLLDSSVGKDPEVQKLTEYWINKTQEKFEEVKGYTRTFISKSSNESPLNFESTGGNLITDALRDMAIRRNNNTSRGWTNIPIAIFQSGGIRNEINNQKNGGAVTYSDLVRMMPFNDNIYKVTYKGCTIKKVLEHGFFTKIGTSYPYYLVFSGLKVIYDLRKPIGERVQDVQVLCGECSIPQYEPLSMNKMYSVIISEFLKNGGDKFDVLQTEIVNETKTDFTDTEAVISYFENHKVVYPILEGRIVIIGEEKTSSAPICYKPPVYLFLLCPSIFALYVALEK